MKLIDLLVQELPKRGGWPAKSFQCAQDNDCKVCFYTDGLIERKRIPCTWSIPRGSEAEHQGRYSFYHDSRAADANTAIITREQYEAALQQTVWNGEGLPPVGCKFEYGSHRTAATCLGVGFDMVFAWKGNPLGEDYEEFMISIKDSSFHVARTEAERKRDDGIKAIHSWADEAFDLSNEMNAAVCRMLYDAIAAGKIPGVKLDD